MTHAEMLALPKTRHEAMSVGSNKYFTGEACKQGHIFARYVGCNGCVLCVSNRGRDWIKNNIKYIKVKDKERRQAHPEKYADKSRKYQLENSEKIKERKREYRIQNSERIKNYSLKYNLENSEQIKARGQKRMRDNPEKFRLRSKRNIDEISKSYVAHLMEVPTKQLTPEIIELKRLQIQLHRAIKESQS